MSTRLMIFPWRIVIAIVLFTAISVGNSARGQDVKVNAGFLSDSLAIGEQTAFFLSARYPSEMNILFPDSTLGFAPFEYQKKKYFPTTSNDGISRDSAVYYLTTFEVDRVQFLDLPVFAVQPQDCTIFVSPRDSILISQMVASVPDSLTADKLPLKMNTAYQDVSFQFNYVVALIIAGVLLVIAIVAWIVFGKRIRAWMTARKMQKRHLQFSETFNKAVVQLRSGFSALTTENALITWKRYMEQLEAKPYTKLTTRETYNLIPDQTLVGSLRAVDQAIYGHATSVVDSLEALRSFADQRFTKKLEEVKHGQ